MPVFLYGAQRTTLLVATLILAVLLTPPAIAQIEVTGSLRHEYSVAPGEHAEGTIRLLNRTDEPQEARLYLADYFFDYQNQYVYEENDTHPRSNRSWVRLPEEYVTIPPRSTVAYTYLLDVPETVDRERGTFWSVILVEPAREFDPGEFRPAEGQHDVLMAHKIRYAMQVATDLPDRGEPGLEFFSPEVRAAPVDSTTGVQPYYLQVDMENTGERGLRPDIQVQLYDSAGQLVGEHGGSLRMLYPGTSARQQVWLGAVSPGSYTAIVLADGGEGALFGVRVPFEL